MVREISVALVNRAGPIVDLPLEKEDVAGNAL